MCQASRSVQDIIGRRLESKTGGVRVVKVESAGISAARSAHSSGTSVLETIDRASSFSSIAIDGRLQLLWSAHLELFALVRVQILHVLSAESERSAGDRAWKIEAFGDLSPQLLVDDLDETSFGDHESVELVQIQDMLGHDWYAVDGRTSLLHKGEEVVQKLFSLDIIGQFIELK